MKKSLLVISVILLIAGLFIACNSEAAGTNSEVGYVKFGDSKELTASVTPESGPAISSLYWYYKATKTSGGIAIGQTSVWKRVNSSSTGLVGTIGPFSKGSWAFELVGTTSADAPSNTSYDPEGTGESRWTIEDDSVKYYGVSGTAGEETRTSITLTTGTTVIPVSLKWRQTSTTATVKFNNVSVLDSSETMALPANTTVYLTVKFGDYVLADSISAHNTTVGSNVYYPDSTVLTIPAGKLGSKHLYVEVYEDSDRTSKVQEGSVEFQANVGDTITITGNIGDLEAYYGEFLDSDKEAAVRTSTGTVYYDTLAAAYTAATTSPNNYRNTIILNKDVTYGTDHDVAVWNKDVDLDLGGRTLTTNSTQSTTLGNNGFKASGVCYGDATPVVNRNVTVKNGTIVTAYGAGIYAADASNVTIENVTIRAAQIGVQSTAEYSSAVRLSEAACVTINSGSFIASNGDSGYVVAVSNSHGAVTINGGSFTGKLYFSTGGTTNNKTITINGGSFNKFGVDNSNNGVLIINGGTFDADPTAYVDTDLYNVDHTDSTWTVTPKSGN